MTEITQEQEDAVKYDTTLHIRRVQKLMNMVAIALIKRGEAHDESKLHRPESLGFAEHNSRLNGLTYGSPGWNESLTLLKPTLDHHYAVNRHHPEHFKNSIADMDIIDIIELICDWKAASERQNNGNLRMTLDVVAKKYNLGPMLLSVLENSVDLFENVQ